MIEISRKKNTATYITFDLRDASNDIVSGATGISASIDAYSNASAPDGFDSSTNSVTEIGSSGIYYLQLTAVETNYDYLIIKVTSNEAKDKVILINTQIALSGADSDTLESISDQLDNLNDITVTDILSGAYEDTETIQELFTLLRSFIVGISSGSGTTTVSFRGKDGTTNRIIATLDSSGNRTSVTVNGS